MSESALVLSPFKFYEEAKKMLEEKDFIEFVSKVSVAIEVSQNDKEMLAKCTYLKAKGLLEFNQHAKALSYIEEALRYNTGVSALELIKNRGVAKGYLGETKEALETFKELTTKTTDINLLVGIYINIAWVYLSLEKSKTDAHLAEAKHYLDLVNAHFDSLSDRRKLKVNNNYSVYYYYKKEYEKAIEILENSIKYCEEEYLPHVYNNLAELYLKIAQEEAAGISDFAKEYLEKAEILGSRGKNNLVLGYIFYTKAMMEVYEEQLFKAFDTLYLAFEFFKNAEATVKACDTLLKINELMDEYKLHSLRSLRDNLKVKLKDTPYYEKF